MKAQDFIKKLGNKYFPCTCDEGYFSRNLKAPDCWHHNTCWEEALKDLAEHLQQEQECGICKVCFGGIADVTTGLLCGNCNGTGVLKAQPQEQKPNPIQKAIEYCDKMKEGLDESKPYANGFANGLAYMKEFLESLQGESKP